MGSELASTPQPATKATCGDCATGSGSDSSEAHLIADHAVRAKGEADAGSVFDVSRPSYHDSAQKILGCPHYQVKARVLAPCCGVWTPCRFCHDEARDHDVDRFAVRTMKCMLCTEEQPLGAQCQRCSTPMGRYYCSRCKLLDDTPHKEIFHCDECGICLGGRREDYFHCSGCNACVAVGARKQHGCTEQILHADCPICGERFFGSPRAVVQATCKHLMHADCLEESVKHSYRCPLCAMSLCDTRQLFCAIDDYMRISRMPPEFCGLRSRVFCNDCRKQSAAAFHFVYHKCGHCSSWNTAVLARGQPLHGMRRDELLASRLWVNDLKSQYLSYIKDGARDLPTDLEDLPANIHSLTDYYSAVYAENRPALTAYRAREMFAESVNGAAFVPSASELKNLEASVVEEERLLQQVQLRLGEKVAQANAKIDEQCRDYEGALGLARANEELAASVGALEAELEALSQALHEKEQKEKDAAEQQTRELQAAHNDLLRETALRDEAERERARLADRLARLKSDEQKRRMGAEESQEQQRLVEHWVRAVAPVVAARVEGHTLVLTLGDGLGAMSNRRILAQFDDLGRICAVRADDGRELPAQLSHDVLMRLLSE
ncbi:hypothetical protein IWQ57_001239 [Coemansia nantahalensis]|uniref:Uncharacterized protein n=1 Tax=Coemansia nantahalensis TaxID=2789366 RepID=A0ACC1K5C6_9FUNG|nr:hypothetical protein IWQ57_001239 [Coemansia nantahalensis]